MSFQPCYNFILLQLCSVIFLRRKIPFELNIVVGIGAHLEIEGKNFNF